MNPSQFPGLVLVVDDDKDVQNKTAQILEHDGYTVVQPDDSKEALWMIRQIPLAFSILMTDINMPGIDGIELSRESMKIAPHLGIILMSGHIDNAQCRDVLDWLGVKTIAKPFHKTELLALMEEMLQMRNPFGVDMVCKNTTSCGNYYSHHPSIPDRKR